MKLSKNWGDSFIYICVCLGTFGIAYLCRVVITMAIKGALKDE